MKVFFRRIHLYLAFVAGLVIMTTCFTGAVLVFEEDLKHLFHKERYFIQPNQSARPLNDLIFSVKEKVPGLLIRGIKIYTDNNRTAEVSYIIASEEREKKPTAVTKEQVATATTPPKNSPLFIAYVNPYSAQVIELYNYRDSFFYSVLLLHRWLLAGNTGKLIVGISTLIFLFILGTGIILWWPKTSKILKQRLKIKWQGGWKRLNHDLHIVLGFYTALFLLIFAFTGLSWSFSWFNKGIYLITRSPATASKPPENIDRPNGPILSYDTVLQCIRGKVRNGRYYQITAPADSIAPFTVYILPSNASHEFATDQYFIDRYQPLIIYSQKYKEQDWGKKVRTAFKPTHTASIGGATTKIIGLIACLCGVIFPVTGYIMWWQRISKKPKKTEDV